MCLFMIAFSFDYVYVCLSFSVYARPYLTFASSARLLPRPVLPFHDRASKFAQKPRFSKEGAVLQSVKILTAPRVRQQRRGPQRSVDMIVSSSFLLSVLLVIVMCVQVISCAEV